MPTNNNFIHTDRCGVTVAGQSSVRLFPDNAAISAAVSRNDVVAAQALAISRTAANEVQAFLKQQGLRNFSASRISLHQQYRPSPTADAASGGRFVPGYLARIGFNIKLNDLELVEPIVVGIIAAGANELLNITYQSSLIDEARNDARRQAIAAAKDKAALYCQEVGVSVGRVLAIQEVLVPVAPKVQPLPGLPVANADPTNISVGATVEVTFDIIRDGEV